MSKRQSNAGKGIRGQLAYQAELANQMSEFVLYQSWIDKLDEDEFTLKSITIRAPQGEGSDYLVIVRAWVDDQQVVGFNGGTTIVEALVGFMRRHKNKTMRWKVDEYAQ